MHLNEAALAAVALEVAKHLEGAWTPDPDYPRNLVGPRGLRLLFTRSQARPRGEVRGLLPAGANRLYRPSQDRRKVSIGVDLGREPAAIAREIERRLLPDFESLLIECLRRIAEEEAFVAGRAALFELLSPLAPAGVRVEPSTDAQVKLTAHLGEADARAVFAALDAARGNAGTGAATEV